ncbi:MAG TPA: hypothetical protein P5218_11855, partial [Planctomycetota bacterium]|nr:hypothetical protein [Planctomycetota bacterium]
MAHHDKSKSHAHGSSKVHDPEVHVAAAGHEDDLIVVPKEKSRLYYLMMLGLMLFVLVIFTVGGLFTSVVGGGASPADEIVMKWTEPGGEAHEVRSSDFVSTMQMTNTLAYLGFYRPINSDGNSVRIEEEDAALALILEHMAAKAGIEISDAEFKKRLRGMGWTGDQMRAAATRYRMTVAELEQDIRRGLRINKFRSLLQTMVLVAPDPDVVAKRWQEANPEFQLQVVEATAAAMLDQAKAEVPSDDVLLDWYHARPMGEQMQLFTEEKLQPEVAWIPLDGSFDSTALMAAYPLPADWDQEAKTQEYYRLNTTVRFKKPVEDAPEEGTTPPTLYIPLDEIQDQVANEARLFQALTQFTQDVRDRAQKAAGDATLPVPNFAVEAKALGLNFATPETLLTRLEIREHPDWGGIPLENQLGMLPEGGYSARPSVTEHALSVARLAKKLRREEPPFAEIRDAVAEKWATARASELSQEKLQAIYDGFAPVDENAEPNQPKPPVVVDAEAFAQAVDQAGLTILERPYLAQGKSAAANPEDETNLDRFLRFQRGPYSMEKGGLAAPTKSFFDDTYYLIRLADKRAPELSELKAKDLFTMRSQVSQENMAKFEEEAFQPTSETFKQH